MTTKPLTHGPAWDPKQTGVTRTRLVLLRHGQTPFSLEGRYAGRQDIPLTAHGLEQATAAGQWISQHYPIDCAVISPLQRCRQTAEAALSPMSGVPVTTLDALVEMDFGQWDGKTYAEVREQWGATQREWYADWAMPAPGGESIQQVFNRVVPAVQEIASTHPEQTVLVVSHVTPIKSILRWALDASPEFYLRFHLDTASVSIIDVFSDGGVCASLLNATHW